MKSGCCAVAFLVTSSLAVSAYAAPGDITNLGLLPGGTYAYGNGINDAGQVTGGGPVGSEFHSFRWSQAGGLQDIGAPAGVTTVVARGIDADGNIAGRMSTAGGSRAFYWSPGGFVDLGALGGSTSQASAMSSTGMVTGTADTPSGYSAFRWTATGGMEDLAELAGHIASVGRGIHQNGLVVGQSYGAGGARAALWSADGTVRNLGTMPGHTSSEAWAVNAAGQVAGLSSPASGQYIPFRWSDGAGMQPLDTLGGTTSNNIWGIHDSGIIVGESDYKPVLWLNDGSVVELNAWLDQVNPTVGAFWDLTNVGGINAQGMLVGTGYYNDGTGGLADGTLPFVMDVSSFVPEPTSLMAIVIGSGALLRRKRARRQANA